MKKILIIILFLLFFTGCKEERFDIAKVEKEIRNLIPTETYENIVLPSYKNMETTWSCDFSVIIGNYWIYEQPQEDTILTLNLELIRDEIKYDLVFNVDILRADKRFYINKLKEIIPKELNYDLVLPTFDNNLSWISNDVLIYNNCLIYDFPTVSRKIKISAYTPDFSIPFEITIKDKNTIEEIPRLNVFCDDAIESKDEYKNALLNVKNKGVFTNYDIKIRLRGNSTLYMPKKPYKIKLNEKSELLGLSSNKDFVLLANFADQTLIRNALAFNFSKKIRDEWTPDYVFVDLYLNNIYQGNYLLTEQIEEAKNKVNLENGGFLIEYDYKVHEDPSISLNKDYFIIENDIPYVIKYPDTEIINKVEFNSIYNDVYQIYNEIRNGNISNIDIESFISWFFVNEIFKNVDSGYSSIYLYKKPNEKLKMGPVWDFDLSSGNFGHIGEMHENPYGWYTNLEYKNKWYYYLFQNKEFVEALKLSWVTEIKNEAKSILDDIYILENEIRLSRYNNFITWDIIGKNNDWYTGNSILEADQYYKQIELLYDFLEKRIGWLDEAITNL